MEPVTHAVLGAVIGHAFFGERLGHRRAAAFGAIANMLPDLDVAAIPFGDALAEWRLHRTLTHALWFGPAAGPVLGWASARWQGRRAGAWIGLWVVALVAHPLLDLFTTYGTVLFWPHPGRFALDAVAIVDPLYTLVLAAGLLGAVLLRARPRAARIGPRVALALGTAYLFYGLSLNARAEREALRQLGGRAGANVRVHAYPTLLQPWLRRLVARDGRTVFVGLLSLWSPHRMDWQSFVEPSDARIDAARSTPAARTFEWFAMGETTARVVHGSSSAVEIEDLRYGYFDAPDHGLWGVRVPVDDEGRPAGPAQRFDRRPPDFMAALTRIARATFDPPGVR